MVKKSKGEFNQDIVKPSNWDTVNKKLGQASRGAYDAHQSWTNRGEANQSHIVRIVILCVIPILSLLIFYLIKKYQESDGVTIGQWYFLSIIGSFFIYLGIFIPSFVETLFFSDTPAPYVIIVRMIWTITGIILIYESLTHAWGDCAKHYTCKGYTKDENTACNKKEEK